MGIGTHSYHLNICPSDNHPVTQIICYIVVLKVLKYSQYGISGCHPLFLVPQSVELGTFNPTLSSRPLWNPITARKSSTNSTTATSTRRLLVSCVHFLAEGGDQPINISKSSQYEWPNTQTNILLYNIKYLHLKLVLESIDIIDIGWKSA